MDIAMLDEAALTVVVLVLVFDKQWLSFFGTTSKAPIYPIFIR